MIYDKVREFFQTFPVSCRISWEPSSQVLREYPAPVMAVTVLPSTKTLIFLTTWILWSCTLKHTTVILFVDFNIPHYYEDVEIQSSQDFKALKEIEEKCKMQITNIYFMISGV